MTTDAGPRIVLDVGDSQQQARFFLDKARYPAYFSGVGGGKTTALLVSFFDYAGTYPESIQVLTEPNFPMVRDILIPKVNALFGYVRGTEFTMTESPPFNITFKHTGAQIWLRSTEVGEGLYGPDVARVGMDEVTLGHQQKAYNVLLGRIRQAGVPNQLLVTGTPKGRNWVYRRYIENPTPDMSVYMAATAENKHLAKEYVPSLLQAYGGWDSPLARQELGASWIQMAGQGFPQFERATHIRTKDGPLKDILGGIDFGGVSPTALVACGLDSPGRVWAFKEWYKHEATLEETVDAMAEMEKHGVKHWVCDPAGKKEMDALRKAGFTCSAARHGNSFELRAQLMGSRLNVNLATKQPGLYIDPSCTNLIREIENLSFRRRRSAGEMDEQLQDAWERGQDDHAYDAAVNCLAEHDTRAALREYQDGPVNIYG